MRAFRDIPIKNKLRFLILLTSGIALLLAGSAFIANEMFTFRQTMVADLFTLSDLVGMNSTAGLLFNDEKAINENLASLRAKKNILLAHIFTPDGRIFASYYREDVNPKLYENYTSINDYFFANTAVQTESTVHDSYFFQDNHLEVYKKILFEEELLGIVYIQSDLQELHSRLIWDVSSVGIVLIVALTVSFLLSAKLQKLLITPIYHLLDTMKTVSTQKNYSIREQKLGNDELGILVDGFNEMLAQVEIRDKELNQYHMHLEEKVNQRTIELAEARDQALAANKAKSIFLANMSHEIRTPMNAVLGYAQILRRDSQLTKDQRESLLIIENSGNHLLSLINDILDISKIEAGAMELRQENFYLNEIVENIAAMFKVRCEQKNLDWRIENALQEQTLVYADQGKLRQILINLLGNAVKFTETGEVVLRATPLTEQETYRFDIIDTGQGIPKADQANIFEPFHQEKAGFDKGGTGLGLAITKRQIELMHGTISLVSEPGNGTQFTVVLPLPEGIGEVITHAQESSVARLAAHYRVHVLVVDDVKENRDILSFILKDIGAEVEEAVNGKEAIEKIHINPPSIVFMDIRMPVMDGMETIRALRQEFGDKLMPCIAISASTLYHQIKPVLDAGFHDFISKPFRFEAVYDCLAKFLQVEFEYDDRQETFEALTTDATDTFKLDQLSLPQSQYLRLREAAELNELTELENIISELHHGDETQQALAIIFQAFLDDYDFDGILESLEQINHVN